MPRGYRKFLRIWRGRLRVWCWYQQWRLARALGLRGAYYRHIAGWVAASGLFDEEYYLEHNPDVRADGADPLLHYVRYGDREGRHPMPLFDPAYYRAHAGPMRLSANALLHYAHLGRFRRVSPSPWFDLDFYLRQNRDVSRGGRDPLRHYLEQGGIEGRSPCRQFDGMFYLQNNPDVVQSGINPLLHYLRFGRPEGRQINAGGEQVSDDVPLAYEPPAVPQDWHDLPRRGEAAVAAVDVVVPVYKGRNETLRCLYSALAARTEVAFELVVIDDASPDETLARTLADYAAAGLFTLLRNELNRGFVHTANRGLMLHRDRDVVLLNSDTEVYDHWLDRLRAAARAGERRGTVTPLSNNATIASYPRFLQDNPYPLELPFAELDLLAAEVNSGIAVEAPTGVGFCMYLRRDCIEDVGTFDEEQFGRGYGEENDFCQRAVARGWRNMIAADVFVHHLGSVSFKGERGKRVADAMRVMARRHPRYGADVQRFIGADPLLPARRQLDAARLRRRARASNTLFICHNRGGGTERHLREDMARALQEGQGTFLLRPVHQRPDEVTLNHAQTMQLPNLPTLKLAEVQTLAGWLRDLRIGHLHNHGMVDFSADGGDCLLAIKDLVGATLDVDVHDYQPVCPRLNLADDNGRYCGEPAEEGCNQCLATLGSKFGVNSIARWRADQHRMLAAAAAVHVPDADVSTRLARYFPDIVFTVTPHEPIAAADVHLRRTPVEPGQPLHVVVVGAIGKVKGYDVLLECARDAQVRHLPLRFSVLGYSLSDPPLQQAGVALTGRYQEYEAAERLERLAPHLVWLPSLWPETYSYTLSLALLGGFPVCAFDFGAIGRRLRELGCDQWLLPLERQFDARGINDHFLQVRAAAAARD